jgi:hypothetical protein
MFAGTSRIRDRFDPDAQAYIDAVEIADEQALEAEVKVAITRFVKGCKKDGIWDAIKASCILAGARTLDGCLVPLKGIAPTNFNFVAGDYNRKTGLKGDGTTKYLNGNRAGNADPTNEAHISTYIGELGNSVPIIGTTNGVTFNNRISTSFRLRSTVVPDGEINISPLSSVGFCGAVRFSASNLVARSGGANYKNLLSQASSPDPPSNNWLVFAQSSSSTSAPFYTGKLSFYSIGESLDLALLDSRVTALMTAFNRYIP